MENQDWKRGLRLETVPVFETVSQMEIVKGLYFCVAVQRNRCNFNIEKAKILILSCLELGKTVRSLILLPYPMLSQRFIPIAGKSFLAETNSKFL